MRTYTTREVAEMIGKTLQAISRYAQNHPGIGRKYGRDWVFTEADVEKLRAVQMGRPTKKRKPRKSKQAKPTEQPGGITSE